METKEQLCKEYAACTLEYLRAHEKVSAVLQRGYEIREGEVTFQLTKELLADLSKAMAGEVGVIAKLQEISHKLRELSQ